MEKHEALPISYLHYCYEMCKWDWTSPGIYSRHSFCRRDASLALKSGVSQEMIKAHDHWISLAYMDFLDINHCKDCVTCNR